MSYQNQDPSKIQKIQKDVDEVQEQMNSNIRNITKNSENLGLLQEKTDELQNNAHVFHKNAEDIKRQQFWKNWKLMGIIICATLLVIGIIVAIVVPLVKK